MEKKLTRKQKFMCTYTRLFELVKAFHNGLKSFTVDYDVHTCQDAIIGSEKGDVFFYCGGRKHKNIKAQTAWEHWRKYILKGKKNEHD